MKFENLFAPFLLKSYLKMARQWENKKENKWKRGATTIDGANIYFKQKRKNNEKWGATTMDGATYLISTQPEHLKVLTLTWHDN